MIKKTEIIQIRVTKQEKKLLKDLAYKNMMNLSDYIRYCVLKDRIINLNSKECEELETIKEYLNKKIAEGKEKFSKPNQEGFMYWNSLKIFFEDKYDKDNIELKSLYWEILINWELNRNREVYKKLADM